MTDPAHRRVFVARRNVDNLLAGNPTRSVLKCRANAVQRLAEDCERFFPWPALQASLMADVKRLRERCRFARAIEVAISGDTK